uniref:Uncharacterized protein n=1 Tax=Arundo donax TaxID=35708 RepID=A0A0A9C480_ARUDO
MTERKLKMHNSRLFQHKHQLKHLIINRGGRSIKGTHSQQSRWCLNSENMHND